jgi:hypothetical protein
MTFDPSFTGFPFERFDSNYPLPAKNNYGGRVNSGASGLAVNARYTCAWGPDTTNSPYPTLIRFVFTIDDPSGRIADGQTSEYVFKVGG